MAILSNDSSILPPLDRGERDIILLAPEIDADFVLMDDRDGVEGASRLGLTVTGTLGLLDRAAHRRGYRAYRRLSRGCAPQISEPRLPCRTGC